MASKAKRQRSEMAKQAYGTVMDMGMILRTSRLASGLKVEYIAECMGTTRCDWIEYEQNRQPIPGHIIIKLMIFGMDFWARNKKCFDNISDDHPGTACHPSTGGELSPQTNI